MPTAAASSTGACRRGGPIAEARRRRPARRQSRTRLQLRVRGPEPLPAALLARREPVLRRAARSGHVRRQRLRRREPSTTCSTSSANRPAHRVLPDNTATNIVAGFPRNVNHAIDLNSFYGYPPAINRTTGVRGEFVTDPSCIYDAATQRFFVVVLTLDPQVHGPCQGVFSCVNHLDLAVSQTSKSDGRVEHLQDRRHERWYARQHRRSVARASVTIHTSVPTRTASTSRRTRIRGGRGDFDGARRSMRLSKAQLAAMPRA